MRRVRKKEVGDRETCEFLNYHNSCPVFVYFALHISELDLLFFYC